MNYKLAIAAVSLSTLLNTQAALNPETFLPENTLAVATIRDLSKDCADLKTTPHYLLLQDPAMKQFRDQVLESWNKFKNESEEFEKGIQFASEYLTSLKGGIALTVTAIERKKTDEPDFSFLPLVIAEFEGGAEKFDSAMKDIQTKMETEFSSNKIQGVNFYNIPLDEGSVLWVGLKDNLLYIAHNDNNAEDVTYTTESLGKILNHKDGDKTLAETELFKRSTNITPDSSYFWLNLSLVNDLGKEWVLAADKEYEAPEDPMEAMMAPARPLAIYNALGVSALKSFSVSSKIENGEFYTQTKLICPANERRGITGLIDTLEATDCAPTEMIPLDVIGYGKNQINVQKFWETVDSTTTEVMGGMKFMVQGVIQAALEKAPEKVDLKAALLNNLTGEIMTVTFPYEITPDAEGTEKHEVNVTVGEIAIDPSMLPSTQMVILLGVKDADLLIKTVRNILVAVKSDVTDEVDDIMGSITKCGNYVAIKIGDGKKVNEFLKANGKTQEKSLAKCKVLQNAVEKVGGFKQNGFNYQNYKGYTEFFTYICKLYPSMIEDTSSEAAKESVKIIEALPDFSVLKKYFDINVGTAKVTDEGIEFKSYTPWPRDLER